LTAIRENGATDWQLTSWAYDNLGRRTAQARANGASTAWGYDGAGRLASLSHDLPGTANDLGLTFTYNPAGQIASRTMSNTAYAYAPAAGATSYVNNGKNQVTSVGGSAVTYDARQNIASAPMGTYAYDGLNQMTSATASGATTNFGYDPAGRMVQMGATRLLHDGARPMAEYDASGNVLRRYVPGLAMDETVSAYEGAGLTDRRWLLADERLSVAAYTNGTGGVLSHNTYDEYGQPGTGNGGLFQYTGQMWLPQAQIYHYKARTYTPHLGRFTQTDRLRYGDGMNIYAYVGADPLNWTDALGLARVCVKPTGSGISKCVHVDGNGDGNTSDDDLSRKEKARFSSSFWEFISKNNGRDISSFGRPVSGTASQSEMAIARVTSQFVGAVMTDRGGVFSQSWAGVRDIRANTPFLSIVRGEPANMDRNGTMEITGRTLGGFFGNPYNQPSPLARSMFHESLHVTYSGLNMRDHFRLDNLAIRFGAWSWRLPGLLWF
jgi:RHS repeat-associated protein